MDLHAHAAKRGAFLYGNRLKSSQLHSETLLFARLAAANSTHLDFDGCCFSQKNMTWKDKRDSGLSKEGSARVAFYYLTGSPHIYTLECNYNTGRHMNALSDSRSGAISPPRPTIPVLKYTPDGILHRVRNRSRCLNWPITKRVRIQHLKFSFCDWSIQTMRTLVDDFEPCYYTRLQH